MKPGPKSATELAPLLVFGAHPDDIEFGCGAVVALETRAGRTAHFVVCSAGESASHGVPEQRMAEMNRAASFLRATVELVELDGDAHLERRVSHAIRLAATIRRMRPGVVIAPTLVENQHPDHYRLGNLVRDAARLARYGGVQELREWPVHAIGQLFFYAVTPDAEPKDVTPILLDVSEPEILATWTSAMEAHASQVSARNYVELQLTRARLHGMRAGVGHAVPLFPNDPLLLRSLELTGQGLRRF